MEKAKSKRGRPKRKRDHESIIMDHNYSVEDHNYSKPNTEGKDKSKKSSHKDGKNDKPDAKAKDQSKKKTYEDRKYKSYSKKLDFEQYHPVIKTLSDLTAKTHNAHVITDDQAKSLQFAAYSKDPDIICHAINKIPIVRNSVLRMLAMDVTDRPAQQRKRSGPNRSVLLDTDFEGLETFKWTECVTEMVEKYPELVTLIISMMLKPEEQNDPRALAKVLPKLGLIYGIMIQNRCHELSRIQRIMSMCLVDNICDQKVSLIKFCFVTLI